MNTPLAKMDTYILNITPQTNVRATQGDKKWFRIPREVLKVRYSMGYARLLRLEKYNKYKIDLMALCKVKRFVLPSQGLCIKFFIPMPKTWRKWQRELMDGKLHRSKPDIDNLLKAFFDALISEDKFIGHLGEISKHWTSQERGWIELEIKNAPYEEAFFEKPTRKK
jgi:Holliday junction resolvase RusA-like endonuclease